MKKAALYLGQCQQQQQHHISGIESTANQKAAAAELAKSPVLSTFWQLNTAQMSQSLQCDGCDFLCVLFRWPLNRLLLLFTFCTNFPPIFSTLLAFGDFPETVDNMNLNYQYWKDQQALLERKAKKLSLESTKVSEADEDEEAAEEAEAFAEEDEGSSSVSAKL